MYHSFGRDEIQLSHLVHHHRTFFLRLYNALERLAGTVDADGRRRAPPMRPDFDLTET